ncbi:pyridoxamine 5'-phosphate oxidase family protein [Rathayibacter sp. KR2-224]|uniref:pyridoxamine 5'-phosphate oxidase family protein n=1 Tax=Rathayibacter sp. KR2-224 TaxID=3400913 RepID=UPI003BFE7273
MELDEKQRTFLETHHAAAMITIAGDGMPKAVRVGVALVQGRIWSSGTADRVRTKRLRRDPRCSLFVFDQGYSYLTVESTVTLLEGADAARQNLQLFRVMQHRPAGTLSWFGQELDEEAFVARMVEEERLIYQFEPKRVYGPA